LHKEKTEGGGAMGVKGVLYELFDYQFTYLLYCPFTKKAVVLIEDGLYAMKSKYPKLRLIEERAVLTVLPFWIYPSKKLLERARKVIEIDPETTEKIFRFAESYPLYKVDEYTYNKMKELADANIEGIFEIVEEAERAYP
jgi:hypothetical protein